MSAEGRRLEAKAHAIEARIILARAHLDAIEPAGDIAATERARGTLYRLEQRLATTREAATAARYRPPAPDPRPRRDVDT